jgi:hypothetical protein
MICDGVRSGGSSVHDCDATGAEWDGRAAVGIA